MAYFPNGCSGDSFDNQCTLCKYGHEPCPIAAVQLEYNYDAVNNKVATDILNSLVKNNGECTMFKIFKKDFYLGYKQ
jgi:formate hydrogenlyase subunit 6/NADH:ubiquinone oxidoreductase subunit I